MDVQKPEVEEFIRHLEFYWTLWKQIKTFNYNIPLLWCRGQITLSNIEILPISDPKPNLLNINAFTKFKFPWHLHKLSSGSENMGVSRAHNYVRIWRNLPISNSKRDLHNINAHTNFGENPLMFTQVVTRKRNTDGRTDIHTDVQRETIIPRHYLWRGIKSSPFVMIMIIWCLRLFNSI